jgi:hypothetical protein
MLVVLGQCGSLTFHSFPAILVIDIKIGIIGCRVLRACQCDLLPSLLGVSVNVSAESFAPFTLKEPAFQLFSLELCDARS